MNITLVYHCKNDICVLTNDDYSTMCIKQIMIIVLCVLTNYDYITNIIEIPNENGKINWIYITDTCNYDDIQLDKCIGNHCSNDKECLSDKCYKEHCMFNKWNSNK